MNQAGESRLESLDILNTLTLRCLRHCNMEELIREKAESEVQQEATSGDGDMGLICMCEQTKSLRERNEK